MTKPMAVKNLIRKLPLAVTAFSLILASCQVGAPDVAQAPTATLAPIVSMTPRFTATPVPSRTPLPTFTLTPSETPIPPTPSDTPTPTEVPPVLGVVQSTQRVNVREAPGTNFNTITALDPGTGVEVIGFSPDASWVNILMEDGLQGWMSSRLLFVEPTPVPPATLTPTLDQTAIALGTTFPTAILGGAPVSPTPPAAVASLTPSSGEAVAASTDESGAPVIDLSAFNMTATALVQSITGDATATSAGAGISANPTASDAVGGPTGGPVGGPTPTLQAGTGGRGQASAQSGVDVLAYCDNRNLGLPPPANLRAGATIDIYWSWYARTEQQLQDHRDSVTYEIAINGDRLTNWRQFAEQGTRFQNGDYYQYWYIPYGPLPAGDYEITYRVTWDEAISDGYQQYGPGTSRPEETGTCTFTVQPAQ